MRRKQGKALRKKRCEGRKDGKGWKNDVKKVRRKGGRAMEGGKYGRREGRKEEGKDGRKEG